MKETFHLKNNLSEIDRLANIVLKFGKHNNLDEEIIGDLRLVLDEIVTNIISYGYENNTDQQICICICYTDDEIRVEVKDEGIPFNPIEASGPDIEKPFEERETGGLGIYIVRKLMDELEYRSIEGKNILIMKKHLKN